MSQFDVLKAKLLSQDKLWEDDDFPAAPESLAVSERMSSYVRWLRPWVSYLTLEWLHLFYLTQRQGFTYTR